MKVDERALWLVGAVFAVHASEDLWGLARLRPVIAEGPGLALLAVGLAAGLPIAAGLLGDLRRRGGVAVCLVLGLAAAAVLHVVAHVALAAAAGPGAPGLFTAIGVLLPFCLWLLGRAWRQGWLTPRQLAWLPVAAVAWQVPLAFALLAILGS